MSYYGPDKLFFVFNLYPLPYHHNAFLAAQACLSLINITQNPDLFWNFSTLLFSNQNQWSDDATQDMTPLQVISLFGKYASNFGVTNMRQFSEQMGWFSDQNIATRIAWKFASLKGIYGTPMFAINGVLLPQPSSTITFAEWQKMLDPLLPSSPTPSNQQKQKLLNKSQKEI